VLTENNENASALTLAALPAAGLSTLAPELASAKGYAAASRAENTRKAYASDLAAFGAWCAERDLCPLPAEPATVAAYLAALADGGRKASTIARALVAISQAHKLAGLESPREHRAVRETHAGIRRTIGTAERRAAPMMPEHLRGAAAGAERTGLAGLRDRALLAVGFAGGFRRSALVALDVADLAFCADGVKVTIRRDKTDQMGAGRTIGLTYGANAATCPVRTLRAWLDAAGIAAGPIFRAVDKSGRVSAERLSDRAVALVVKAAAERAGLEPDAFAGHSLRAGLATAAARAGKSDRAIMRATGHRSRAMVDRYVREAELFSDTAAGGIGL
jgi:site-specific recombinase XerD